MKKTITATDIWIKLTGVYLILPIYLAILFGTVKIFGRSGEDKSFLGILPATVLMGLLISVYFLIRSGKLALPLMIVLVFLFSATMIGEMGGFRPDPGGKTVWTIEGDFRIPGMDVYCNGVHMGQTPLRITEDEFLSKVKPWDTPPRQERTSLREEDYEDDIRFGWARYTWIPSDFIEYTKRWPAEEMQRPLWGGTDKDQEIFEFCKKTPYWWRFEKDGCIGLTDFKSLLNWGGSGGPWGAELSNGSSVEFPSLDKHFEVFIADLKRNNWQPTEAWMNHFAKYKDLLFGKLYEYAQGDTQAKPALDAVVRREMNIPSGELSRIQRRQVLDMVLRRTEEQSEFRIPSFESQAALLACKDMPEMISEYYRKAIGYFGGERETSSGNFVRYGKPGPAIRLSVMRWIVSQYQPPQLYNQLVYSVSSGFSRSLRYASNDRELLLVLNYPRPESEKILDYCLKSKQNQKPGPFGRASDNEDIIRFLTRVHNPLLEYKIRRFIENNPGRANFDFETRRFVQSRVDQYPTDPNLPGWIMDGIQLPDYEKVQMIAKLRTQNLYHYLNYLCARSDSLRDNALEALKGNPFADEFIIDSYRYYDWQNPRRSMCEVIHAMAATDTPKIREFISEQWDKGGAERKKLLERLRECSWYHPHMNWLVEKIKNLSEKDERIMGMALLPWIGTEDARKLLENWANDPAGDAVKEAAWQLEYFDKKQNERQTNPIPPETIDALLSGQVKPDDLLPPATAYIWDGEKYVPEKR